MVAMPIVLHTRLTGRKRLRRNLFGRYVMQVEEVSFRAQLKWPGCDGERPVYTPPDTAPLKWRDARDEDTWMLSREGLL